MPSSDYYERQADTLARYAGACDDTQMAGRLLRMARQMLAKAEQAGDLQAPATDACGLGRPSTPFPAVRPDPRR